jgi:hypothetical protein
LRRPSSPRRRRCRLAPGLSACCASALPRPPCPRHRGRHRRTRQGASESGARCG